MIFVSYSWSVENEAKGGFGNVQLEKDGIHSWDDVVDVCQSIKNNRANVNKADFNVFILNWRRCDAPL